MANDTVYHPASRCIACDGELVALPIPSEDRAVLSDGRVYSNSLAKAGCRQCGLISHARPLAETTVRAFYNDSYSLAAEPSPTDVSRSAGYARVLADAYPKNMPNRVLEVGCGAGHTLDQLSEIWAHADFVGYEAAPAVVKAASRSQDRITVRQGFAEDIPPSGQMYDFIYSVNVFEHAADPIAFLLTMKRQLAGDGVIAIICPATQPPNLELLFIDHVHSFSTCAVTRLARRAGLRLDRHVAHPAGLGDFQMFLLSHSKAGTSPNEPADEAPQADLSPTVAYLNKWRDLDTELNGRTAQGQSVILFGAGEMAAILRAYAPQLWARVSALLVDDLSGARALGVPVVPLSSDAIDSRAPVVVATHPRSQAVVAERLAAEGRLCVTFSDIIGR